MVSEHRAPASVSWGLRRVGQGVVLAAALAAGAAGVGLVLGGALAFAAVTLLTQASLLGAALWRGPGVRAAGALVGPERLGTGRLVGWGVFGLLSSLGAGATYALVAGYLWEGLVPPPLPEQLEFAAPAGLVFVLVVLTAPLVEELFFRGFVCAGLAGRWGWPQAGLASAALFAASHGSVGVAGPAFCAGLVFAWLTRRTGSVWPAILAHTLQNALAFGLTV
ncbi:MAG: CPBP family intramembrane glutamic endopeptidase [Chloroflexota bacterium]